jgi:hypothetical protein
VLRPLTGLLYQPRMIGDGDCVEIGRIKIGKGNRSTRRKPTPAPLLSITKSHMTRPGFEPRQPRWEASDYLFIIFFYYLVCEAIGTAATLAYCASLG